jgi:hypothetical protein
MESNYKENESNSQLESGEWITSTYPDMTMHYQRDPEQTVKNWIVGPAGDECSNGKRYKAGR